MSLRTFMHPRNTFKDKPDFKQLAISYPEFRAVSYTDLAGNVKINFKDPETLRVLAKTLLKDGYKLDVEIPSTKLVPCIPLRVNYVLWIEDLVRHAGFEDMSLLSGIDIGTGPVCVYPLLLAKLYQCKMTGTEIDSESCEYARRNIKANAFDDIINVVHVNDDTILKGAVPENVTYTFTMCNPPFFDTTAELLTAANQTDTRPPPRNAPTGSQAELSVKGGETEFVTKMIDDSIELRDKIKIYTTMLGRKSSVGFLLDELENRNINNVTWTQFCQGRTTRWGLAWSFLPKHSIDLTTAPVIRRGEIIKQKMSKPPIEIIFPAKEGLKTTDELISALKQWIELLKIRVENLNINNPDIDCWACQLTAQADTWSHQRRKRRMNDRINPSCKRSRGDDTDNKNESEPLDISLDGKTEEPTSNEPFLRCQLVVGDMKDEDNDATILKISMSFIDGSGGRDALQTLRQYFINRLNVQDEIMRQNAARREGKKQRKLKR